jgi:methylmalonyl-CoA mutase C-terminal domain/subunit
MTLFKKLLGLLEERDARDIVVIGGGIIPEADIPLLKEMGVAEVFTPGARTTSIVDWVQAHVVEDDSAAPAQA